MMDQHRLRWLCGERAARATVGFEASGERSEGLFRALDGPRGVEVEIVQERRGVVDREGQSLWLQAGDCDVLRKTGLEGGRGVASRGAAVLGMGDEFELVRSAAWEGPRARTRH